MTDKSAYMLVFSPHPIDTEWGIAGTVARMVNDVEFDNNKRMTYLFSLR